MFPHESSTTEARKGVGLEEDARRRAGAFPRGCRQGVGGMAREQGLLGGPCREDEEHSPTCSEGITVPESQGPFVGSIRNFHRDRETLFGDDRGSGISEVLG